MELAELLEREAITDGDQVLTWARARAAALIAEVEGEDPLRSLLVPGTSVGAEAELDAVPVARRRRREPSSPQPKSADELPPPPEHPRLAEGEPEPVLETVDTGPIDLEEEIVRRRKREDSWAIAAREVESFVGERERASAAVEVEIEPEPSIEIEIDDEPVAIAVEVETVEVAAVEVETVEVAAVEAAAVEAEPAEVAAAEEAAPVEVAVRADSVDSPIERPEQPSQPELPVVVGPVESSDLPVETAPAGIDITAIDASAEQDEEERDEDFEVDELVELEVDELVELEEEVEEDEAPSGPKPPRPPPPKSAPPPIRNEVASLIAELSEPVRTGDTVTTRIDEVEGTPKPDGKSEATDRES